MKNIFYSRLSRRMFLILSCSSMYLYVSETPESLTLHGLAAKAYTTFASTKLDVHSPAVEITTNFKEMGTGKLLNQIGAGSPFVIQPAASVVESANKFSAWNPDPNCLIAKLFKSPINNLPMIVNNYISSLRQETLNATKPYKYVAYTAACFVLFYMAYQVWSSWKQIQLSKELVKIGKNLGKANEQLLRINTQLLNLEKRKLKKSSLKRSRSLPTINFNYRKV